MSARMVVFIGVTLSAAAACGPTASDGEAETQKPTAAREISAPPVGETVPAGRTDASEERGAAPKEERPRGKFGEKVTQACVDLDPGVGTGLNPAYVRELVVVGRRGVMQNLQREESAVWSRIKDDLEKAAFKVAAKHDGDRKNVDLLVPVSVIDEHGVREAAAVVGVDQPGLDVHLEESVSRLSLATQACVPPKDAKVEPQRLSAATPGAERAAQWATRKEGKPYKAVGEVRGRFGADVDRVVVVAPGHPLQYSAAEEVDKRAFEEFMCEADFAIAMKGDRVHGDLSVARPIGAKAQRACAKDLTLSMEELGLAGVADLDGDGVDELLWTYNHFLSPRTQSVVLTGFSAGKLQRWNLADATYSGSEAFLDPERCGRSKAKPGAGTDVCLPD